MERIHWLDTNAYSLLYSPGSDAAANRLRRRIESGGVMRCAISEITSLEIHSVLGKHARAQPVQHLPCERTVETPAGPVPCPYTWRSSGRSRIRPPTLRALNKLILDAENERGSLRVTVYPVPSEAFHRARAYLQRHALHIPFGSHDALIAACATHAQARNPSASIRLVTSDRGLKRLLEAERIPHYDPLKDILWTPAEPRLPRDPGIPDA